MKAGAAIAEVAAGGVAIAEVAEARGETVISGRVLLRS
jgi:hypothetical protein